MVLPMLPIVLPINLRGKDTRMSSHRACSQLLLPLLLIYYIKYGIIVLKDIKVLYGSFNPYMI